MNDLDNFSNVIAEVIVNLRCCGNCYNWNVEKRICNLTKNYNPKKFCEFWKYDKLGNMDRILLVREENDEIDRI